MNAEDKQLVIECIEYRYEKMQNAPFSQYLHKEMQRMVRLVNALKRHSSKLLDDISIPPTTGCDNTTEWELLRDFEDPCGTIHMGVTKTECQWLARFTFMHIGEIGKKTDWFKAVSPLRNSTTEKVFHAVLESYTPVVPTITKRVLRAYLTDITSSPLRADEIIESLTSHNAFHPNMPEL